MPSTSRVSPSARRIVLFRNAFSQEMGLRFRRARPNTLYVFDFQRDVRTAFSMWFVFHPIDIYFLDEERRTPRARRSATPSRPRPASCACAGANASPSAPSTACDKYLNLRKRGTIEVSVA